MKKEFGDFQKRELQLLNIIENQNQEIINLHKKIQLLEDEINRLKGEDGKPKFGSKKSLSKDISSEKERKDSFQTSRKTSRRKKSSLPIHYTKYCYLDKAGLPEDIQFKGYTDKIVQGLKIETYNTLVKREIYYSKYSGMSYTADLPVEYHSSFSVELQSFIINLKFSCNMTEPKILEFLEGYGIQISAGSISNIILNRGEDFSGEREAIFKAGLLTSECIQSDTTSSIENGVTKQVHVFNSPLFSVFFTKDDRKRITIVDILRNSNVRIFALNDEFFNLLDKKGVARKHIQLLNQYKTGRLLGENEINKILSPFSKNKNLYPLLYELSYICGYHSEEGFPVVKIFLTDDAPVYDEIGIIHLLCWIHVGRHFKKLNPLVSEFRDALDEFLTQFWNYYHALLDFKQNPTDEYAKLLNDKFNSLFSKVTCYDALNERIEMTYKKKEELTFVLKNPSVPLHNNESELQVRKIVRHRDVSLHTKNKEGTKARDVFLSMINTAKKLGVNFYDYLVDRLSNKFELPSLVELILNP